MLEKCSNCKFFRRDPSDMRKGSCHKNPPQAVHLPQPGGVATLAVFTPVPENEWCGEWKPTLQTS